MTTMRFNIIDPNNPDDVVFRGVSEENVYIAGYGKIVKGRAPCELAVDESCEKEYGLSGQKATRYVIVRTA